MSPEQQIQPPAAIVVQPEAEITEPPDVPRALPAPGRAVGGGTVYNFDFNITAGTITDAELIENIEQAVREHIITTLSAFLSGGAP